MIDCIFKDRIEVYKQNLEKYRDILNYQRSGNVKEIQNILDHMEEQLHDLGNKFELYITMIMFILLSGIIVNQFYNTSILMSSSIFLYILPIISIISLYVFSSWYIKLTIRSYENISPTIMLISLMVILLSGQFHSTLIQNTNNESICIFSLVLSVFTGVLFLYISYHTQKIKRQIVHLNITSKEFKVNDLKGKKKDSIYSDEFDPYSL